MLKTVVVLTSFFVTGNPFLGVVSGCCPGAQIFFLITTSSPLGRNILRVFSQKGSCPSFLISFEGLHFLRNGFLLLGSGSRGL